MPHAPSAQATLEDRVAFVVGGNSGIGRVIAVGLHHAGATVAIGGRRHDRNLQVSEALAGTSLPVQVDATDETAVADAIQTVVDQLGRLDILVYAAGVAHRSSVLELEQTDWDRVLATNLTGAYLCTKYAARQMAKQGAGKIIHISSVYGMVAPSRGLQVAYTVSKHGLFGLVRANAVELAPLNIQVNAIAPGFMWTEMTDELRGAPIEAALVERTPSGEGLANPEHCVGLCVFLASDASSHLTGTCIPVDGGYVASDGLKR